jgi:DNA-binding NtrC family response regulator
MHNASGARRIDLPDDRMSVQSLGSGGFTMPKVIIIDDDDAIVELFARVLMTAGFDVTTADAPDAGLRLARSCLSDVIILDDHFPSGGSGRALLKQLQDEGINSAVVMVSGVGTALTGFDAAQLGAAYYLEKPVTPEQLVRTASAAAIRGARDIDQADAAALLLGESGAMRRVRTMIRRIADADGSVLIEGATGTGKELAARALHGCSHRISRPFVAANCAGFSESLLDSELFGHVRGAFTGATDARAGLLESAEGGTLFLDEVSSMPGLLQTKLLRALESGEIRRVGENRTRRVRVRIVAATNCSLTDADQRTTFRADLLYRLNTYRVQLPELRHRLEDVPRLAEHFVNVHSRRPLRFTSSAVDALMRHEAHNRACSHICQRTGCNHARRTALIHAYMDVIARPVAKITRPRAAICGSPPIWWSTRARRARTAHQPDDALADDAAAWY